MSKTSLSVAATRMSRTFRTESNWQLKCSGRRPRLQGEGPCCGRVGWRWWKAARSAPPSLHSQRNFRKQNKNECKQNPHANIHTNAHTRKQQRRQTANSQRRRAWRSPSNGLLKRQTVRLPDRLKNF
jgi:hypothetical protein